MDSTVRSYAALSLRRTHGEPATNAALAAMKHADPVVRGHVVQRFVERPDTRASESLTEVLDDPVREVRFNALTALSHSGNAKAVGSLLDFIDHEDAELRQRAGVALRTIASRFAVQATTTRMSPLSQEDTSHGLRLLPRSVVKVPLAYVEMLGGDCIAGEVVRYAKVHSTECASPILSISVSTK